MQLVSLQGFGFRFKRLKPYLPIGLYDHLQRIAGRNGPSKKQLNQIDLLGENIGLTKSEVRAALNPQLGSTFMDSRQRITQFIAIITILIIAIISVLVTWFVVDPESFPIPTYVPGSLYGSIAPRDFSVYGATAL